MRRPRAGWKPCRSRDEDKAKILSGNAKRLLADVARLLRARPRRLGPSRSRPGAARAGSSRDVEPPWACRRRARNSGAVAQQVEQAVELLGAARRGERGQLLAIRAARAACARPASLAPSAARSRRRSTLREEVIRPRPIDAPMKAAASVTSTVRMFGSMDFATDPDCAARRRATDSSSTLHSPIGVAKESSKRRDESGLPRMSYVQCPMS